MLPYNGKFYYTICAVFCCTMIITTVFWIRRTVTLMDGQLSMSETIEVISGGTGKSDVYTEVKISTQQPERSRRYTQFSLADSEPYLINLTHRLLCPVRSAITRALHGGRRFLISIMPVKTKDQWASLSLAPTRPPTTFPSANRATTSSAPATGACASAERQILSTRLLPGPTRTPALA
jgi:hypothetical protein